MAAWVVPGSQKVKHAAEAEGLDTIFTDAGLEWREPGCSACLGMNPDKVPSGERCASTSNRNFVGRQGPGARTHLVSPAMAAAAAVTGRLADAVDKARVARGVKLAEVVILAAGGAGLVLAQDGFLMFSCLGPDTLIELRTLYAELGWPEPSHAFTDMHDWGDMLVHAGFAEPVMDMERITLTFATPERLLAELRTLGRNLHVGRFAALRGRGWQAKLLQALDQRLRRGDQLALSFEIIYGHAFKPAPRAQVSEQTAVSLDAMRSMLRGANRPLR